MKILIATPLYPPDIGGPATYAKILEDELPKQGVTVSVVSFHVVRHLPKGLAHIVYAWKLFRALFGVDMLLALDPVSVGLPSALVALLRGKKFIVRVAGDYAWEQGKQRFGVQENLDEFVTLPPGKLLAQVRLLRAVQYFVASHAERVIVPSKYLKEVIAKWGVSPEKIVVVYNAFAGVPTFPPRDEVRKRLGWSGPTLFSAGRLVPWKGFGPLVGLMPEIRKRHPGCKLYIAGSGPLFSELKTKVSELGLGDAVTLLGDMPREKLTEQIYAADCFVLNTGYEGFSHQLLEVLSVGTPIVSTSAGGNREVIEQGVTGVLVGYNDTVALLRAATEVLTNTGRAREMSENGKQFAANFTVERMVKETLAVLNGVKTTG
ncbi:MAG: hypothetical protein A3C93_03375 [Candidatus Lloydbacteria bacterium RIFCSPHIGHO2_02_FULL_54_17]|uniref:Glycosyltransferase subfamily 4-like N-terminal domain-containing protein n=1 Tax=Candidatus Lloydbacteria bacterium RIFCSPHIGHO2_02_FULL_54_17 TaxID=1798664 RepID=A0A1G2DFA1_9BACT|nr:MAG: hypothetical protein A2762_00975 [Candidatus Lloydbacteria bacterium RIFCSPHIGHO2_01_FULL_54_11]OGZ12327.1 MAG: hypothetical protein A3C93_03375 [Candidatus Lloydbacteria bacterium RIFCSPHIGHO2_02_FULL_54_17]OGZ14502.1 MAG: hypothetical protein A3H76_06085 [Candidatus Lloydbacteria bacterium RIFCSPLOWO2_02_FULL_54_12]OGZ14580.1 MAG: hypothetical protein A2948_05745 [Candidatus Lloydbacteria bacterium RIFCSPLOWO2_01_FULL_54_18]